MEDLLEPYLGSLGVDREGLDLNQKKYLAGYSCLLSLAPLSRRRRGGGIAGRRSRCRRGRGWWCSGAFPPLLRSLDRFTGFGRSTVGTAIVGLHALVCRLPFIIAQREGGPTASKRQARPRSGHVIGGGIGPLTDRRSHINKTKFQTSSTSFLKSWFGPHTVTKISYQLSS